MKLGTLREFLLHFPKDFDVVVKIIDEYEIDYVVDHVGVAVIDGKVEIYGVKSKTQDNK